MSEQKEYMAAILIKGPMISRRRFTAAALVSTTTFTGCITDGSSSDLIIYNRTENMVEGEITVKPLPRTEQTVSDSSISEEPIVEDTFTIQSSGSQKNSREYAEIAGEEETVVIHIDIRDGPIGNHQFTGTNSDSKSVTADVRNDTIEFVEGQA